MHFFEDYGRFQTGHQRMRETLALAHRVAPTLKPVLIIGSSGTGKKEMALEIIEKSSRAHRSLVRIKAHQTINIENSAGIILVENLEQFNKSQQEMLLKGLAASLGDHSLDCPRWIFTACREILTWVRRGEILPSLYHVLAEQILTLPDLSERKEDIEPLTDIHISELNETFRTHKKVSSRAMIKLRSALFERNLTELFERIDKAYMASSGPLIDLKDFGYQDIQVPSEWSQTGLTLSEMERRLILQTLDLTNQNRTKAAEILGISIRTLRNKLSEYRDQEGA